MQWFLLGCAEPGALLHGESSSTALRYFKTWLTFSMLCANLVMVSSEDSSQSSTKWSSRQVQLRPRYSAPYSVAGTVHSRKTGTEKAHLLIWDINSAHSPPQGELNELSPYSKQQGKKKKLCIEISICMSWHGFIEFKMSRFRSFGTLYQRALQKE